MQATCLGKNDADNVKVMKFLDAVVRNPGDFGVREPDRNAMVAIYNEIARLRYFSNTPDSNLLLLRPIVFRVEKTTMGTAPLNRISTFTGG